MSTNNEENCCDVNRSLTKVAQWAMYLVESVNFTAAEICGGDYRSLFEVPEIERTVQYKALYTVREFGKDVLAAVRCRDEKGFLKYIRYAVSDSQWHYIIKKAHSDTIENLSKKYLVRSFMPHLRQYDFMHVRRDLYNLVQVIRPIVWRNEEFLIKEGMKVPSKKEDKTE